MSGVWLPFLGAMALYAAGMLAGYVLGRDVEERRWRDHIAKVTERTIDEGLQRVRDAHSSPVLSRPLPRCGR